jgi:hypothetical protein
MLASGLEAEAAAAAELEVYADLEHVHVLLDVHPKCRGDECSADQKRCAVEVVGLGAEAVEVVFGEAGEPIQEGVFAADAQRPPTPGFARRGKRP